MDSVWCWNDPHSTGRILLGMDILFWRSGICLPTIEVDEFLRSLNNFRSLRWKLLSEVRGLLNIDTFFPSPDIFSKDLLFQINYYLKEGQRLI